MKIAVIMMFRDEADILAYSLSRWQQLGVDRFFLCDNGSKDESATIARRFTDELMTDTRTNWPGQENINILKNRALATNHDWIFPADADEFLELPAGCNTLRDWLYQYDQTGHAYGEMKYLNILPKGETNWQEPHRKVFGRFRQADTISMGNHLVIGQTPTLDSMGAYYKHYSMRSFPQFRQKMLNYMIAFADSPFQEHPHAQSYRDYQREGETYLENLWTTLTGCKL